MHLTFVVLGSSSRKCCLLFCRKLSLLEWSQCGLILDENSVKRVMEVVGDFDSNQEGMIDGLVSLIQGFRPAGKMILVTRVKAESDSEKRL